MNANNFYNELEKMFVRHGASQEDIFLLLALALKNHGSDMLVDEDKDEESEEFEGIVDELIRIFMHAMGFSIRFEDEEKHKDPFKRFNLNDFEDDIEIEI